MSERTVTLSTYPLPDREAPYWQVMAGGMPVIRETTSQADATAAFYRVAAELEQGGRKVRRLFWNGYLAEETSLDGAVA